ncbi:MULTISPECIES: magnesium/cobalt transporter CorA [unclassified Clostridium]|uniref:magnesium/cobalt transporter CorA n=1 Tax=unclassified Clostridium TaxID=2614128 RepID=UPI000297850F|nr:MULTISPECIES: magnesium/cobalt transporter CorA [unclassified Clostridium]EKQ52668.1 MAG: magnesium Mg(2+) and cobalt Co(2+) transport protein CorA [Clostridium sp. Maddingley MBC34-26]
MNTTTKKRSKKAGLPPGSLIYTGEKKDEKIQIKLFKYSEDRFEEKVINLNDVSLLKPEKSTVHWINVEGIHDAKTIERIGSCFGIHPLVLEDILNTGQRPKIENYEGYTYIVVKMLFYDNKLGEFTTEQESFILGENYVISFSEGKVKIYNTVCEGIRQGSGRIRKMGADYLVYNLLDAIVDNYFVVLEELSEKIEDTEDELVLNPSKSTLQVIHKLKRQMLFLHKSVWPLREVVSFLERSETTLVRESVDIYIRDLYDHVIQVMDTTETLRDILSSMLDMYLSSVSNKMNEIMKVLTIISTVFIPLSFIVGLYGMNLKNMPEYDWPWMYPVVWVIMISIATSMLIFFKRKKWW